jgi:hypothetical protein
MKRKCSVLSVRWELNFCSYVFFCYFVEFQASKPQFMHTVHAYKVHFHQIKPF